ncbi:MAG: amidase [Promethearchaeota archaeon]|nr:MAG: amidase [Candidatus Lokiarchaeota archaeon]
MIKEDICFMPACDMAEKIKTQELTSVEITETIIERIEKINPIINAYCTTTFDLARDMAKRADNAVKKGEKLGLLHGIPTSIKDLFETKGVRTTYGSKIWENFIPDEDNLTVERLKKAGIVFLGKTNTPEEGHKAITDNLIFGETKNPWHLNKTCGGSSGGAAAAVATGLGPLALGSDGGGSIRIPSSLCGVYGLKPNYGRIPRIWNKISFYRLSHYGPIVRFVKDAALMLDVMAEPSDVDKYSIPKPKVSFLDSLNEIPKKIKIGYSLDLGFAKAIDPEVEKIIINAVHQFEKLDWSIEEVKIKLRKVLRTFVALLSPYLAFDYSRYLKDWKEKMSTTFVRLIESGKNMTSEDIIRADLQRIKYYNLFTEFFKNYDVLITPTTAVPAFDLGKMFPDKIDGKSVSAAGWMPYTYPFNMTGHPAASIPCGWTKEGLPVGMQIVGKLREEATVLQVSKAFEEVIPWQDKKPNLI